MPSPTSNSDRIDAPDGDALRNVPQLGRCALTLVIVVALTTCLDATRKWSLARCMSTTATTRSGKGHGFPRNGHLRVYAGTLLLLQQRPFFHAYQRTGGVRTALGSGRKGEPDATAAARSAATVLAAKRGLPAGGGPIAPRAGTWPPSARGGRGDLRPSFLRPTGFEKPNDSSFPASSTGTGYWKGPAAGGSTSRTIRNSRGLIAPSGPISVRTTRVCLRASSTRSCIPHEAVFTGTRPSKNLVSVNSDDGRLD